MAKNKSHSSLSVKTIILLSSTLLFGLWLIMMAYTWINIQIQESNHQIHDELHDVSLTTHLILKTLNEALLTNGTIPSLNKIHNESKKLSTSLNTLKNTHNNNNFIATSINEILKEKIKLDQKITLLNNESNEISMSNPNIMLIAGGISATIESILKKINKLTQHADNKALLAKKDIKASIFLAIIITVIISLLIFIFLYKGITKPFSVLLHETEKLEMEKAIAEKANRVKSEFLSRMNHELRTPLHAIIGFSQILELKKNEFNEEQESHIHEILTAGNILLSLINEVLDLTKIDSGEIELSIEEVDVDELMKDCIPHINFQVTKHHIEFSENVSNTGYTVLGDYTRLKQILLNIISNAIKFSQDNGRITLDSEIVDNKHLRINVTYSGESLTDEQIAKLFTPFERLNTVTNTEGAGIGLVISKHIIELMKGSIGVTNAPNEGSTFWLEIELIQPQKN